MSNMLGSKHRPTSLRDQANSAGALRRNRGRIIKGQYDRLKLVNKSVWVRFNPRTESQYYSYPVYNPETNQTETARTIWFRYVQHFVRGAQGLNCSSGPGRDKACWSCAYVDAHYARLRKEEKETGVRKSREESRPGVDTSPQFAFGVTVMEEMYAIPVMDKRTGQPRMAKNSGQPIVNYVPKSLMGNNTQGLAVAGFGRPMHLSVSQRGLDQLLNLDDYFCSRHCANCAEEMPIVAMGCPVDDCTADPIELDDPLVGDEAMEMMKSADWRCNSCSYIGQFVPTFTCKCKKPVPGTLTAFDVRIKQEKGTDDDKGGIIRITKVRLPKIQDKEVEAMVMNSLELDKIFAPSDLEQQARILGDRIKGLTSPLPHKRDKDGNTEDAPPTSPYDDSDDKKDDDDEDSDEAEFD